MRKLWLITTEHLKAGLWFRDEEDYKVGMNFVALQAHASRVVVLSFTLIRVLPRAGSMTMIVWDVEVE